MRETRFPVLDHLVTMTDDVGVFQHARYDVPNRAFGYCTDDVARGLIVSVEASRRRSSDSVGAKLTSTYLSFLHDAQQSDGWFHNFMGYDRRWQDRRGTEDAYGRAMWGLGHAASRAPRESWRRLASDAFERGLPHADALPHMRSRAYTALGILAVAASTPHERLDAAMRSTVTPIVDAFRRFAAPDWRWCENVMTYDNARLCEALIRTGSWLGDAELLDVGLEMFHFYAANVVENGMFVPIGNDGWYPRGGVRARFGQQPLEAASLVDAALAAYAVTGDERDRSLADIAGAWFFGRNTHGALLITDGGCRDGIDAGGASENMGAESTLAYMMSAIALGESQRQPLRIAR